MTTVKDALNDLKWHRQALERAVIEYVHRGAPGDTRRVAGSRIVDLGASFFELRSEGPMPAMIPYHRVVLVELDGEAFWQRRSPAEA